MKYNYKQYAVSVRVRPPKLANEKRFLELVRESIKQREECFDHGVLSVFVKKLYRRYRRGKNRCKRCGFKI